MHIERSIEIEAPVETVWAVAQDPARRLQWDHRVSAYRFLGEPGAGTELEMTVAMGLLRPRVKGKLLRFEPPRQSVVQTTWSSSPLVPPGGGLLDLHPYRERDPVYHPVYAR